MCGNVAIQQLKRWELFIIVIAVCLLSLGAVVATGSSGTPVISVTGTAVEDDEMDGSTIKLELDNNSNESVSVNGVELFDERTGERIKTDFSVDRTVGPSGSRTIWLQDVPLPRPGLVDIRVEFRTDRGTVTDTVTVESTSPELVVDTAAELDGGSTWNVSVTVGNSFTEPVRRATVGLDIEGAHVENPTRVRPEIGPGESTSFSFSVTEAEAGPTTATVDLSYRDPDSTATDITVAQLVTLPASVSGDPITFEQIETTSSPTGVTVEGAIRNNADIRAEQVIVRPEATDSVTPVRPFPEAFVGSLSSDETVPFETTVGIAENRTTVPLVVEYQFSNQIETTAVTITHTGNSGVHPVRLSGVETTGADRVQLRGEVANAGEADVTGVEVAVVDTAGVDPASPQPDLFIGSISSGGFDRFDLNAAVESDIDAVPVDISYVLDGIEYRNRVAVSVDTATQQVETATEPQDMDGHETDQSTSGSSDDSGLVSGTILTGIVILAAGAGVVLLVIGLSRVRQQ